MGIRNVSSSELDGTTVTATFGTNEIRLLSASYSDSLETEFGHEMGSQEQDYQTPGQYKTEPVSMKIRSTRFRAELMPLFPDTGAGNAIVQIAISFFHPDIGADSDLLQDCRCVNWGAAVEASSKAQEVELKWTTRQIYWTDERKTINNVRGKTPGVSRF